MQPEKLHYRTTDTANIVVNVKNYNATASSATLNLNLVSRAATSRTVYSQPLNFAAFAGGSLDDSHHLPAGGGFRV